MDINAVWSLLRGLVSAAELVIPGASGKEKKAWCIDQVLKLVNAGEVMLGIGAFMNLPIVDSFERYIIGLGVERAWVELKLPVDNS